MQTEMQDIEPGAAQRRLAGHWRTAVLAIGVVWSLFQLVTLALYPIDPWLLRAIHFAFASALAVLLTPAVKRSSRHCPSYLDLFLVALAIGILLYLAVCMGDLNYRIGLRPTIADGIVGVGLIMLTLELARRLTGPALPIVALLGLTYALAGADLPGLLGHGGYEWDRVATFLLGTDGIYGDAMAASATFVSMFILFGAFLAVSGASSLFSDLATSLAGGFRGGPAKVSVIASSMFGTISGSAVANVMVDGWLTIPTMVGAGVRPTVAAAVEAVASCGGQIMPPIMSASAFVMAQITGIPYVVIALAAVVPAVLYYAGLYWMIDFDAASKGLKGLPRHRLPALRSLLIEKGYLLLPIVALFVALLVFATSPIRAALVGLVATLLCAQVRVASRFTPGRIIEALYRGAEGMVAIAVTCGCAGIVVGVLSLTGLGQKFISILVTSSGGSLPVALILSAITTIILGMGVPTVGAYIIAASTAAPALVMLGAPELTAHLFVLYFAVISTITPPVAIAVFAAAGIARTGIWRTGWEAVCLAFAGYLVPFLFVARPGILLHGDALSILEDTLIGVVGVTTMAAGFRGWFLRNLNRVERCVLLGAAILLLDPGIETTVLGLVAIGVVGGSEFARWLRQKPPAVPTVSERD